MPIAASQKRDTVQNALLIHDTVHLVSTLFLPADAESTPYNVQIAGECIGYFHLVAECMSLGLLKHMKIYNFPVSLWFLVCNLSSRY